VEVWLNIPGGTDIALGAKASDMHAAIDVVVPKLERQIIKLKGKHEASQRRDRKVRRAAK
jgi:ribosomal subunit interface protein